MKNQIYLYITLFVVFFGCGKELPLYFPDPTYSIVDTIIQNKPFLKLRGDINEEVTLHDNQLYYIEGKLSILKNAVLNIEPGVVIYASAEVPSMLLVERGGRINAVGSEGLPIVFTSIKSLSNEAMAGDWIGIHINGNAAINGRATGLSLVIGKYGKLSSALPDDDSGSMKYVRVEYGGKEINGISGAMNLNGLGNLTDISYIQTYRSFGHGIRIRGGEVNLSKIVSTQTLGTGIMWDNGWIGKGQFWISHLVEPTADTITLMQGASSNFADKPVSNPILSNITLLGDTISETRGLRLRSGTFGVITNSIISKTVRAVRADYAEQNILDGKLSVRNCILSENALNFFDNSISRASLFFDPAFSNVQEFILLYGFIGSSALNVQPLDLLDEWFKPVRYIGAVQNKQNDWTKNWIKL